MPACVPTRPVAREALPITAEAMRKRLLKKGFRPGSAGFPGLERLRGAPQITTMSCHGPRDLIPLIPLLKRRARRLARTAADAEDILQDTLLQLCQRMEQAGEIEDLHAYAMRTLTNRARRSWRPTLVDALEENVAITVPDPLVRLDCAETLAAIERLPKRQRDLLRLVAEGETSPRALARRTGLPLGTVMSRLARARVSLRLMLEWEPRG